MLDTQKEYVMQIAKELTLSLIDKYQYTGIPGSGKGPGLIGNKDVFQEAGEDFKLLVAKVAEALKTL